jgi:hypothetical protein
MPFTAAELTAFWTNPDMMGISDRTCQQMTLEGLVVPSNFEDFSKKSDLDALFKLLLKPAKVVSGHLLKEVASYVIPAKSQIQIDGACKMVLYYILVGRTLEADNLLWPVIKNFVEQWEALMEKKKATIGNPPRLSKDKVVHKWLEQFTQYLGDKIGARNAPFTYLTRPESQPPAIFAACAVQQPYSVDYESIEQELKFRVAHDHTLGKSDNNALYQLIDHAVAGNDVSATVAPFCCKQDGPGAYLAIVTQHAGKSVWDRVVKDAMAVLQGRTWSGTTSVTLLQHTAMQRKAFIQLSEAGEHVPTKLPGDWQRVSYLLDSLKTDNPKMLAGTAAIEQDELGKRVSFESSVAFLLQFDPVNAKNVKAKGLGVNVPATSGDKTPGGVTMGTSGVELRWYEPQKFSKLSKEQKAELSEWNKTTNSKKDGNKKTKSKKGKSNEKWKKACIAAVSKANTKLMEAMSESHNAEIAVLKSTLASMTGGNIPGLPPAGAATGKVGSAVAFHPGWSYGPPPPFSPPVFHPDLVAIMQERASVASLKLACILKPPKKDGGKPAP